MGTLLLSCVCDSIVAKMSCVCDSVLVKSYESGCRSMTVIQQAGTNWQDICIVFIICLAVVGVVLIAERTLCSWKNAELEAKEKERTAQKTKEEEESKRKIQSDLLDKYLDFLKERTKGTSSDENKTKPSTNFVQKVIEGVCPDNHQVHDKDLSNINQYRLVLEYLIELSQKNQLNTISKDTLKSFFNEVKSHEGQGS